MKKEVKVEQEVMEPQVSEPQELLPRHGFVTFWLWLSMVFSAIVAIFMIVGLADGKVVREHAYDMAIHSETISYNAALNHVTVIIVMMLILVLVHIFARFLLLGGKKLGFKIEVFAPIAFTIYMIIHQLILGASIKGIIFFAVFYAVGFGVAIAVLYAILNIRKNGVPYWSQLK